MRKLLTLFLCLMLAACGFHLRGVGQEGGLNFTRVRIDGSGPVAKNLREYLSTYRGITLVEQGDAETVIQIQDAQYSKEVSSVNNSGRVAEYRLNYRIHYSATQRGEPILEDASTGLSRYLSWNDNSVLSKESEEAMLLSDMQRDVIQLILRRVSAAVKKAP